ncbi:MAG: hypothetical protein ABI315_09785 [Bacteroidia bacterium]
MNASKGGRVYIPLNVKKGFVASHTVGSYDWIFTKIIGQDGYVKKRE